MVLYQLSTHVLKYSWNNSRKSYAANEFCPFCLTRSITTRETVNHLWVCQFLRSNYQKIHKMSIALLKQRYKINIDNCKTFSIISRTLQLTSYRAIKTLANLIFLIDSNPYIQHSQGGNTNDLILAILDCFFSAFYTLVWKPRCNLVQQGTDQPLNSTQSANHHVSPLKRSRPQEITVEIGLLRSKRTRLPCDKTTIEEMDLFAHETTSDSSIPSVNTPALKRKKPPDVLYNTRL
jgi:hypothetical protein